jgi:hypothetical protein
MEFLTANPVWMFQDTFVFLLAIVTCFFIIKKEPHPIAILMEMIAFAFLYALVYENAATLHGTYAYGRSILMFGNVPLAVALLEWFVVYATLRLLSAAKVPIWIQPFIVGLCGVLQDATIDPVAVRDLAGGIGRWTWHEEPGWVLYLGVPVYNFTGWFFLTGFSSAMLLVGRFVHRKLGYGNAVGYIYPAVAMAAALLLNIIPVPLLIWLSPTPRFGNPVEWVALGIWLAVGTASVLVWRWRMERPLTWHDDWPVIVIPAALHFSDIVSTVAGGYREIVINELAFTVLHLGIVGAAFWQSRTQAGRAGVQLQALQTSH